MGAVSQYRTAPPAAAIAVLAVAIRNCRGTGHGLRPPCLRVGWRGERSDFDMIVPGTPPIEQGATRPRSMGHGSVRGLFLRMTGAARDRMMKVIVV
jgi:hypothetical protein